MKRTTKRFETIIPSAEADDDRDEIAVTEMNTRGGVFTRLAEEPELYTDADLVTRS